MTRAEISSWVRPTENREIVVNGWTVLITWAVELNKLPTIVKTWENKHIETKTQARTKPILGVQAWYDWETEYERVRNQIIKLWVSYEIAEHITREAYTNTSWAKQFIRAIIWVANAEWWIFQRGKYNNYLWVMLCSNGSCRIRDYVTVQAAITHWREMYNKNKRYVRITAESRLRWHYCTSECSYRVSNYNAWIYLLNI